ncbi:hypothetical protein KM043_013478 [Ampulex compressa]|nr:hypothetical protein KM043_013478 [Ampulex compressa]
MHSAPKLGAQGGLSINHSHPQRPREPPLLRPNWPSRSYSLFPLEDHPGLVALTIRISLTPERPVRRAPAVTFGRSLVIPSPRVLVRMTHVHRPGRFIMNAPKRVDGACINPPDAVIAATHSNASPASG